MISEGRLFTDRGIPVVVDETPPDNAQKVWGGTAVNAQGAMYVQNLEATKAPANKQLINGIAHTPKGRMYVTTQAPDSSLRYVHGGIPVRSDGAVYINYASASALDQYVNGWAISGKGAKMPPFAPIIANRAAWFKYNTGITAANGRVSAWADQSGNNRNLLQATAANQPVNGTPGANLAVNGNFATDSDWNKGTGWTIGSGVATCDGSQTGNTELTQGVAEAGAHYLITYTVSNRTAGFVRAVVGNNIGFNVGGNGTYADVVTANNTSGWGVRGNVDFAGSIDNVTVQKITADGTIYFDGIARFLKTAPFTLNQPITRYILAKSVTWTSGKRIFDGNTPSSVVLQQFGTTPQIRIFAGSGLASISPTLGEYSVITEVINGNNGVLQLNSGTPVTGAVGANNAGGITLGSNGGTTDCWNGQAKEILIYNVAHDANQRAAVIAYLNMVLESSA